MTMEDLWRSSGACVDDSDQLITPRWQDVASIVRTQSEERLCRRRSERQREGGRGAPPPHTLAPDPVRWSGARVYTAMGRGFSHVEEFPRRDVEEFLRQWRRISTQRHSSQCPASGCAHTA